MEWNLRRRLEAARDERKHSAEEEEIDLDADASSPAPTPGAPRIDYRTVRTVRETQEAQLRARREAEARKEREAAERKRRGAPVVPLIGSPRVSAPPPDGSPATVSTIMRQAVYSTDPIITTKPAQERCPNCGGGVRIDMFDLVQGHAHLSCVDCGFTYTATSPNL
jgi:hypothetical protein